MTSQQFIYRLASILEHNSKNRLREREKSGKINSGRLGKYGATNRLFMRKSVEHKEKEYSIAILVDSSGSMTDGFDYESGPKMDLAKDVVSMLAHQLEKVKGVSFEITIFNSIIMQSKSFDEPFDEKKFRDMYRMSLDGKHTSYLNKAKSDIVEAVYPTPKEELAQLTADRYESMSWREENCAQNYDGLAIYRVYRRLVPRSGKRVILTFSDGYPTQGILARHAHGHKTLRGDKVALDILTSSPSESITKAIASMHREGIETIGIGIGTDSVKQYYHHTAIIDDRTKFYTKTLTALTKIFKKV